MSTNYYAVKKETLEQEKKDQLKIESYLAEFSTKKEQSTSESEKTLLESLIATVHCHSVNIPMLHIGKNSMGWRFTLNSSNFNSIKQLEEFLSENPNYLIIDEYNREVSLADLKEVVKNSLSAETTNKTKMPLSPEGLYLSGGEWS